MKKINKYHIILINIIYMTLSILSLSQEEVGTPTFAPNHFGDNCLNGSLIGSRK